MKSGGEGLSAEPRRATDGLVEVEREIERRDVGVVATYRVTTENERPVAVRIVNELPDRSTDGTGFHPAHEPRWWTVEDGELRFKDTVGNATPATFEFGLTVEGGFDESVTVPAPEIAHAEPVGVTREGDRVVFPDRDGEMDAEVPTTTGSEDGKPRGGLLSGVRSAVFGGEDDEVVRASDLDPDAMVVAREETTTEGAPEATQLHAENPTLTPAMVPLGEAQPAAEFSALPAEASDADAESTDDGPARRDSLGASDTDVLSTLLTELQDDEARTRLREELGLDELQRTRTEVRELRQEVATLREEVAATADANETTEAHVSELCRAVDGLAATLDRNVAVVPPTGAETETEP